MVQMKLSWAPFLELFWVSYYSLLESIFGLLCTGVLFCKLMKHSHRKGFIDRESYIAQYLALSIFTIGVASSIGVDDLLASFAAG